MIIFSDAGICSMAEWSAQETSSLLGIWGAADVQSRLDGVVRNKTIYEKIARELVVHGYERTWQQCRTKVKNLVKRYRMIYLLPRASSPSLVVAALTNAPFCVCQLRVSSVEKTA